jgi:hypothetical protein
MQLELRQKDDKFFASLTDADASLQSLDVADGMILHVVDTDSNNPLFAVGGDDSMVEKFELSDQAYETRSGLYVSIERYQYCFIQIVFELGNNAKVSADSMRMKLN